MLSVALLLLQLTDTARFQRNGVEIGSAATTVTSLLRHRASVQRERAPIESTTFSSSKTSKRLFFYLITGSECGVIMRSVAPACVMRVSVCLVIHS